MEILDYKAEMLGDVAGLFTRGVANVPNCWPVDDADFAGGVAAVSGGECDGGPPVEDQALSVATVRGEVVGFAHSGIDRRDPDEPPRGAICFLYYERGCRSAGQGLLAAAESTFAARSLTEVCAFDSSYRYRFYCFPHAYLSDHLDHVSALLQFNGYRLTGGEVFLNGLDYEAAELPHVDLDFDLAVTWPRERGRRPGCHVLAHRDGKPLVNARSPAAATTRATPMPRISASSTGWGWRSRISTGAWESCCCFMPATRCWQSDTGTPPSAPPATTTAPFFSTAITATASSTGPTS